MAILAGARLAASHISQSNCAYVSDCQALLAPPPATPTSSPDDDAIALALPDALPVPPRPRVSAVAVTVASSAVKNSSGAIMAAEISTARAALACAEMRANTIILGPGTLIDTVAPIAAARNIVTAAITPSPFPPAAVRSRYVR